MSCSGQKKVSDNPAIEGWDVRSVHSDEEDTGQKEVTTNNGANSTTSKGKGNERNYRKISRKPDQGAHQFSQKFWRVFKSQNSPPPGGRISPVDMDDSGPAPILKAFSRKSVRNDEVVLKTFSTQTVKTIEQAAGRQAASWEENTTHCSNPAYIPSLAEEEDEKERRLFQSGNRRCYEAPIYSVNSAGRPVPITIEESENEGYDMEDEFAKPSPETQAQSNEEWMPSASTIFARNGCCCNGGFEESFNETARTKVRNLWRITYRPDSPGIFFWLCVVTTAFLYNLWTIPLRATYMTEIQSSWKDIWFACDAVCDLIYIIDIFIKFRTSYIKSGVFVTDLGQLNRHHRRKWTLALDILSIVPTDLFFMHSINPYYRLNRVIKVHRVYTFYRRGELSTWSPHLWRSLNLVHIFVVVIHYNACFYYALSSANGFGTQLTSWSYPDPTFFPEYATLYRRYTYSFYWCMVGLGIVNDRYFPETDWQFVFSIYLHILGMLFFVVFIGFVTVLMFGKEAQKFEFETTIHNTKEYMKQRKLPKELRTRVLRFYQYSWVNQQFPYLDEDNMLRFLPISIRQEIELHSNLTALKQIPSLMGCDSNILRDLVTRLQRSIYLPGQFVYRCGDLGTEMYVVGEGILQVVGDNDPEIYSLREGDVFGELDLLNGGTKRRTVDVISYGYSELYVLSSDAVTETLKKYPEFMNLVHQQEKRRQAMAGDVKEYKAFGVKYQAISTASMKSPHDPKVSASKVHFRMSNGGARGTAPLSTSSTDSGIPSSPSVGPSYTSESPVTLQQEPIKAHLIEKISDLYQDHMKTLKASLDGIWYQEISYLHQRLDDTEQERDMKAREVTQLRRQLSKKSTAENSRSTTNGNTPSNKGSDDQSDAVVSRKHGGSSDAETVDKLDNSGRKVIRSVKQRVNEFEATIQPFGSVSSIGES